MKIVASTSKCPGEIDDPFDSADLIELRLDLAVEEDLTFVRAWADRTDIPLILTLRSKDEGGAFSGTPEQWFRRIRPLIPFVTYVDIEHRFSSVAREIGDQGPVIVGSYHTDTMVSGPELRKIEKNLRSYCGIPKIVVAPEDYDDVLRFLSFTLHAEKPVVTSIMGEEFRHMRLILPFFGSEWIFGYLDTPTSAGQYRSRDLQALFNLVSQNCEEKSLF